MSRVKNWGSCWIELIPADLYQSPSILSADTRTLAKCWRRSTAIPGTISDRISFSQTPLGGGGDEQVTPPKMGSLGLNPLGLFVTRTPAGVNLPARPIPPWGWTTGSIPSAPKRSSLPHCSWAPPRPQTTVLQSVHPAVEQRVCSPGGYPLPTPFLSWQTNSAQRAIFAA